MECFWVLMIFKVGLGKLFVNKVIKEKMFWEGWLYIVINECLMNGGFFF